MKLEKVSFGIATELRRKAGEEPELEIGNDIFNLIEKHAGKKYTNSVYINKQDKTIACYSKKTRNLGTHSKEYLFVGALVILKIRDDASNNVITEYYRIA